jgi:hypothetical protein
MVPEIECTIAALRSVKNPRYLATERGYHGAFYCALRSALEAQGILSDKVILEMEYQKSSRHGTTQRPDIILHIPTEVSNLPVTENNFCVWALKRGAKRASALDDFWKLDEMCEELRYRLAVFVNIGASRTWLDVYSGPYRQRIHAMAYTGGKGEQIVHAYFENGTLRNENIPAEGGCQRY